MDLIKGLYSQLCDLKILKRMTWFSRCFGQGYIRPLTGFYLGQGEMTAMTLLTIYGNGQSLCVESVKLTVILCARMGPEPWDFPGLRIREMFCDNAREVRTQSPTRTWLDRLWVWLLTHDALFNLTDETCLRSHRWCFACLPYDNRVDWTRLLQWARGKLYAPSCPAYCSL